VYARRSSRGTDSLIKRQTARWFYSLFNRMSETNIPENVGDYRLMDRRVVDAIKKLPEKVRFMKGLFSWPGFRSTTVEFERQKRAKGDSKFNYWKLWNFALSGITSFSSLPIRAGTYLGLMIASVSFCYGFYIITKTLLFGRDAPGYASIMVVVLFLGGVQLFFMGLMGEYIGRIYKEVKNRPLYIVEREIGFKND
jgi:glycosyltransferase involved in cell wall biosynthesis